MYPIISTEGHQGQHWKSSSMNVELDFREEDLQMPPTTKGIINHVFVAVICTVWRIVVRAKIKMKMTAAAMDGS